jgi:hypothetical protein
VKNNHCLQICVGKLLISLIRTETHIRALPPYNLQNRHLLFWQFLKHPKHISWSQQLNKVPYKTLGSNENYSKHTCALCPPLHEPHIERVQKPRLCVISFHNFFRISNFFGLSITEETLLVEIRIWCIKIGIVLVLHINPWVEASAGGLVSRQGSLQPSSYCKYFGTCFKIRIWIELSRKK